MKKIDKLNNAHKVFMIPLLAEIIAFSIFNEYKVLGKNATLNAYYKTAFNEIRFSDIEKDRILNFALTILKYKYNLKANYQDKNSQIFLESMT